MELDMTRRGVCAVGFAAMAASAVGAYGRNGSSSERIERWGIKELTFRGPQNGNPFVDVVLSAAFRNGNTVLEIPGFYDGDGVYRIRFCPPTVGPWRYVTKSSAASLDGKTGQFLVTDPARGNHGPVQVKGFHFVYADGTPYRQLGTTCYAWSLQKDSLCDATIKTLAASPFNKIRMALFPNGSEPTEPNFPYVGTAKAWDYTRFNPVYYRRLEKRLEQLCNLGVVADIILFHPYDGGKWGFDAMPSDADDRYLRYTVARLSAYRNVWWSMANEYDLMKHKTETDFDRFFQIVQRNDPYGRLRSIHNCFALYDNNKPWVTHASVQGGNFVVDPERAVILRDAWRKPVVYDEVKYEGTHDKRWAQLSGEEMVHRFWQGTVAGTYVGHSELFDDEDYRKSALCWLGTGGVIKGTSASHLKFLRDVLETAPDIDPIDKWEEQHIGGKVGEYYLLYFGKEAPTQWAFTLPRDHGDDILKDGMRFAVEILDVWNGTVTPVADVFTIGRKGQYAFTDVEGRSVALPGKPMHALRIKRVA